MADVVDKGMGAALLMALSRTLIRTYAAEFPNHPEHLLQVTNQRILTDIDAGLFVTLFYGVLDPISGNITYSNAGHPHPHLFLPGEAPAIKALSGSGMPLGVSEEAQWQSGTVDIKPGGMLLLYTDGVLEAQNQQGEFLGEEGMLEIVKSQIGYSATMVQDTLLSGVKAFSAPEPQVDDITLMVIIRDQALGT